MRLTKHEHACVTLDDGDRRLLIDPGIFTSAAAYEDVHAVLITHEHVDHVDVPALTALAARVDDLVVHAPAEVVAMLPEVPGTVAVTVGDIFEAAGFGVRCVGGQHAEIVDALPGCANLGFLVDDAVYHPGDSLHVPEEPVGTLLLPTSGPWLKLGEAIGFARAVAPSRAVCIHDVLSSDVGAALVDRWLTERSGTDYQRLPLGGSIEA